MRFSILIVFCWLLCIHGRAQNHNTDTIALKTLFSIQKLADSLYSCSQFTTQSHINDAIMQSFEELLQSSNPMQLPWDSLKTHFSILSPPNRNLLLITWNIPQSDECNRYYGLLWKKTTPVKHFFWQKTKRLPEQPAYKLYHLNDNSNWLKQKSPELYSGTSEQWPGMLYTAVIAANGYYLLLGWNGKDAYTQCKSIEALWFDSDEHVHFGKPVFKISKKNPKRLIFEYSKEAQMSLRYDAWSHRIIFSHLGPRDENPSLIGQYAFYGPDGSFDALNERDNRWILEESIDIRNKRSKLDNAPKPDAEQQLQLYPIK